MCVVCLLQMIICFVKHYNESGYGVRVNQSFPRRQFVINCFTHMINDLVKQRRNSRLGMNSDIEVYYKLLIFTGINLAGYTFFPAPVALHALADS